MKERSLSKKDACQLSEEYKEVLQKRINYTLSKLEFEGKTSGLTSQGFTVEIKNQSICTFKK